MLSLKAATMQNLHRLMSRLSATSLGSSASSRGTRVLRNFSTNSDGGHGGGNDDKVHKDKSLGSSFGGMGDMGSESVSSWSTGVTTDHSNGKVARQQAGGSAGGGAAHSAVVSDLQEIEDKLRELEAENKKIEGFVDGWGERMRVLCVLLKQIRQPGARGSCLKDSEKAEMYRLHKEYPGVYTAEKLAKDYKITRQRVHAILWLKEIEEEDDKKLGRPLHDSVERLLDTCPEFFISHDREFHVASLPYKPDFNVMPESWDGITKDLDEVHYEISKREDETLYQEFFEERNFNKRKMAGEVKLHKYSRPRPSDGWTFTVEKMGPRGKRGGDGGWKFASLPNGSSRPLNEMEKMYVKRQIPCRWHSKHSETLNSCALQLSTYASKFRFFSSTAKFPLIPPRHSSIRGNVYFSRNPCSCRESNLVGQVCLNRCYSYGKAGDSVPKEWTEEIEYLDESGSVIYKGKGVRSVEPGNDDHVMIGEVKKPFLNAAAVAKIVEVVKRWKWGPELENQLDKLQFIPNMIHIAQALKVVRDNDACLSLFRWSKRQPWYSPNDECYVVLFDVLNQHKDFDGIQLLFDEMVCDSANSGVASFVAYNRVIQYLAKADKLEISFCCFKKIQDAGWKIDAETYNSLITLFLSKGLPYKAFEIYENMETANCSLDSSTYELMIPNLAKSGRLDAALKLFQEMKGRNFRPGLNIFASLVDSMGKAGRLDAAMKVYMEIQGYGYRPPPTMFVSLIESYVKSGKLETALRLWDEMKKAGFRPNFGLYTMIIEAHAKSGKLDIAMSAFSDMEKAGFLPTPSTYSCLLEMHAASGQVDAAMKLYNSMTNAGLRPGLSTYTALLILLANKKLVDVAAKILLEMKAMGYSVDVTASDILMVYIKDGSVDLALRWLRFMGSSGIRTNNFIIRQLFESCMKKGLYESAKPLLETYVNSAAKVDLILYTSILAHLVRCQEELNEKHLMSILSSTKHRAHTFMCGLFTGPEQRKQPVLSFVREFFQSIDYELEEGAARYFVNVLINYLVLMGQINRARCVWKVAYENKLFPKAIVFDQHIAWSLDVRNLSVGAALIAVVHTLHRFRKRMLYYGIVPRRIKLVTGPTLKIVVAQMLSSVESPFEVSKVVLRAPGDSVMEWFKKPIVQQFLLNEIPSRADILMHKLNTLFPSSAPEVRSLSPPKPLIAGKAI